MPLDKQELEYRAKLWNDVTDKIRSFFRLRGYLEVQTPLLVASPGMEPNLSPLALDVHTEGREAQTLRAGLITSPEYSMKKLLGGGLERIFTLTPAFRDRELPGQRWSIEFTMLEWYRQGADYRECMQETEELINDVMEWTTPWRRVSFIDEWVATFGFVPQDDYPTRQALGSCFADFKVYPGPEDEPVHEKIDRLFQTIIWPNIPKGAPFFLCEYPVPCASLSKVSADGRHAERFEAFVGELELCNGFTELVDANEQRRRFEAEAEERRKMGKEVFPIDEELLSRLASVASPTFGNALGVDRLVMLKAGAGNIDAVHLFPPSQRY